MDSETLRLLHLKLPFLSSSLLANEVFDEYPIYRLWNEGTRGYLLESYHKAPFFRDLDLPSTPPPFNNFVERLYDFAEASEVMINAILQGSNIKLLQLHNLRLQP